jgi:hypothetical protein
MRGDAKQNKIPQKIEAKTPSPNGISFGVDQGISTMHQPKGFDPDQA